MIKHITLRQFRSYDDAVFSFSPGVNVIVGPNGSGKTNLLESVLVMCRGSSYRVRDSELISFGQQWLRLEAVLADNSHRVLKVDQTASETPAKTYSINDKLYRRMDQSRLLPVVLFEPNHLRVLHGSPEGRRNYLDGILEQTSLGYSSFLRNYRRALIQRNTLLKRAKKPTRHELFPWDLRLSELGATISRARQQLVDAINREMPELYSHLADGPTRVTAAYKAYFSPGSYESHLMRALEESLSKDIVRGFTGHGPHREDMVIAFDARPAAEVASRGETRTAVLALKIIELQVLEKSRGSAPLLLLDDVFSELDSARRAALTEYLQNYQTFITTTDADTPSNYLPTSFSVRTIDLS